MVSIAYRKCVVELDFPLRLLGGGDGNREVSELTFTII